MAKPTPGDGAPFAPSTLPSAAPPVDMARLRRKLLWRTLPGE
jgi:hypothetical protein